MLERYKNPDNDPRGVWLLSDLAARNRYSKGRYSITTPSGKTIEGPPAGSYWRVSKERFQELDNDNRIWWGKTGSNRPGIKRFLSEVRQGVVPQTIWHWKESGQYSACKAGVERGAGLGSRRGCVRNAEALSSRPSHPPDRNRRRLHRPGFLRGLRYHSTRGSCPRTGKKGGNRRFILVECEGYADSITAERVRRVIKGVPGAKDDALKAGLGGSFSYFELGRPMRQESLLDGSHLPSWEKLASYIFFTATGQEFDPAGTNRETGFVGPHRVPRRLPHVRA